ncbi:hypothetical protein DCC39_09365 [Pueribacillus theae]|uniref:Foldase protein PrsA n=1 Tax=Pueribacillus theae TaxID=2171751 RepID=A0A2U1K3L2_9BACI|nr:peptidylprolyl isomerase [Pueribacillus theae]PWA11835.1 hypothetical protein DCC39_09365 [Pueribacillus theae]
MKKAFLALTMSAAVFSLAACNGGDKEAVVETNAGNVTKDEFYEAMKKQNGDAVIQQLVEKKLLEEKYKVSKKEVDNELKKIKEPFESDEQFEMALAQSGFGSEDQLKDEIRFNLLRQKAATEGIKVTDEKLKDFYNENKDMFTVVEARHILVKDEKKAKEVKEKLDKGAKFEDMVKEYSTDTASVPEGGKIGEVTTESQLVPEFIEASLKLKEGEISGPVKSSSGFHIIKADKRTEKTLENNREDVKNAYLAQHAKPYDEVLNNLIKNGDVKVQDKQFTDLFKVQEEPKQDKEDENAKADTGDKKEDKASGEKKE